MSLGAETRDSLRKFLSEDAVLSAHSIIRAIGGLTRYRIIVLLNRHPPGLTATDLMEIFDASPSKISHQIHILKKYDLIVGKKLGQKVVYRLNETNAKRFL